MDEFLLDAGAALWLGILTSVSPCPLASNLAALAYVGRRVSRPRQVLLTGLVYTLGRVTVYLVLGALLVASLVSAPSLSEFLQTRMNQFLGPLLILVGMVLLGLLQVPVPKFRVRQETAESLAGRGLLGAFLLGGLFALSFCPVSAALFFGSLIPLAVQSRSEVILPSVYGIGTGLPVLVFSFMLAGGIQAAAKALERVAAVERHARAVTGMVFVAVGIYLSLVYIFRISL